METDLSSRHAFYSAIEGEYSGSLTAGEETYNIKFTFARSLPPYEGARVRQLSEIENDLNNLFFHMQIVQWHPSDTASAVGCRVSGIRPNMTDGTLVVASSDCPNLYNLFLSQEGNDGTPDKAAIAKAIAAQIKAGNLTNVEVLTGSVQPSSNADTYSFRVKRTK